MQPFTIVTGVAAALPAANIDTDQIMPKQFLKGIDRSGLDDGASSTCASRRRAVRGPGFVLNRPPGSDASLPDHRPEFRLRLQPGTRRLGPARTRHPCVIGTTFGGIFADNCHATAC